jgi:hypothetical protein
MARRRSEVNRQAVAARARRRNRQVLGLGAATRAFLSLGLMPLAAAPAGPQIHSMAGHRGGMKHRRTRNAQVQDASARSRGRSGYGGRSVFGVRDDPRRPCRRLSIASAASLSKDTTGPEAAMLLSLYKSPKSIRELPWALSRTPSHQQSGWRSSA